jgi:UDP-N-acetylglucosamine 2-epimerase (non-hydrolysing)
MPLIDIIAGARPNFMKIAPIIRALQTRQKSGSQLLFRLVHTGQHYDQKMSGDFFDQLDIPAPDINLNVGSGTQSEQTAAIMINYEKLLFKRISDLCLVVGDVNSTMACAITAKKMKIRVAHVEAGIRSGDWSMPEEINRLVTDAITDWFFTTSEIANTKLRNGGVEKERIFFVGNTMIDTLLRNQNRFQPPKFWEDIGLKSKEYFVLTLHRPANVDQSDFFVALMKSIGEGADNHLVVFPAHPRTRNSLKDFCLLPSNFRLVDPQPYLEFNYLVKNAKAVITDSGGITEEATVLGVPCLTLRDSTERPETVSIGTNELIGTSPANLKSALDRVLAGQWKKGKIPKKWDGLTGNRIVDELERLLV